ncbi:hypothetical protein GE09DRAFT_1216052 [Coniochaeta sp. 2T2.1]|nr:hypothetical protein GE09DRAFT_1216052 [Coniochaeta sp. 2T2.1]
MTRKFQFHGAKQNARLVVGEYYRAMYHAHDKWWNLRDTHMFETLQPVLQHRGPDAKAILCKEAYIERALAIGCCSNTGKVAAAHNRGDDMSIMDVRHGMAGIIEELTHSTGGKNFFLELRAGRPQTERMSHYSTVVLPEQFNGFVWFDETLPVQMREVHQPHTQPAVDETRPFGR